MREILFRGKTPENYWVYGYYTKESPVVQSGRSIIETQKDDFSVVEETVGQYIGLTDKNGKKIFEGDILQGTIVSAWNKEPIKCKVVYKRDGFICEETIRGARICDHKVCFAKNIEVIGNIHDNPELLEVEE